MSYKLNHLIGGENNYMNKLKKFTASISMRTIMIFLVIFLFLGIGIYIYTKQVKSKFSTSYSANNEHTLSNNGQTGEAELLLFYADWCPHCKTAKPIWEEIKSEFESKTINGYSIVFTEVNCTTETPEVEKMMNTYKVEGFPTIKLLKNGQVIEYDAKPSKATLQQFLNTAI
jgi:thiol-disulfide isomerase/thioredoxin